MHEATVSYSAIVSVLSFAVGVITSLGVYKYYLEPLQAGSALRKKYGTALWIACKELNVHLERIEETLADQTVFDSLLKIPTNDWNGEPDWFTKQGFYTMVTAHKIAQVSAWIYIYQQELLFSRTRASSELLADLYNHASTIRKAFGDSSCLWPEYFDGIGSQYVERIAEFSRPLSFSAFCLRCSSDRGFMKFYDQLHMFIHLMAKDEREREKRGRVTNIRASLVQLMNLLEKRKLLAGVNTKEIGQEISQRSLEAHVIAQNVGRD